MATTRKNWLSVRVSAWRRFYAHHHLLCDNNVALKYRLRLLTSCVVSSMYWCAGSWILTSAQCANLRAVLDRMLRKMIYVPRLPDESAESHMMRWARLLRNCRAKHKFPHGDEKYFASYFSWCGHTARFATRDPKRESSKLFQVAEPEKGKGHTMLWMSVQSVEVGASSGPTS